MKNLLDLESFGKDLEDLKAHAKYILPILENTLGVLDSQDYEDLMSKKNVTQSDRVNAKRVIEIQAKKMARKEVISLLQKAFE